MMQQFPPDSFFTEVESNRLQSLMARWRAARDMGSSLPAEEQKELERLVVKEVEAAGQRAAAMIH